MMHLNNQLQEVQSLLQQSRFAVVQQSLKNLFKDEQTDLSDIDNKAVLIQNLSSIINNWERNGLDKWVQVWQEKNLQYSDEIKQSNLAAISEFIQLTTTFNEQKKNYETLTGINFQQREKWLNETVTQLQNIQTHLPQLRNWMNYVQLRKQGDSLSLQWLINAYENKLCDTENITDYFNYTVHASIAQRIISQHECANPIEWMDEL